MAGDGVNIDHFRTAGGVGRGETASCCVRSAGIASRRRVAVLAHLGSVDAAKSPSIVARRVASLSRRRDAAVSCRALEGPRPLSICREAGQGVPLVYLPILCRRSARVCGVAASTVGRHTVGRNPGRQGELVHHGGQQMCQHESPVLSPAPTPARPALWDPCGVSTIAGSGRPRSVARPR